MKKALVIITSVFLILSLFACANNGGQGTPSAPTIPEVQPGVNANPSPDGMPDIADTEQIGFFDPDADYSKNERFKVIYMMASTGVLYAAFSNTFRVWAERTNCEYSDYAAGDNDTFMNTLETYATQDVDGFILDPDSSINQRVLELAHEYHINWMGGMSAYRDEDGKLQHPTVGLDNTAFGAQMAAWLIDYAKTTWRLDDFSKVGFMSIDYSISDQIHERATGAQTVWNERYPELKENYLSQDGLTTGQLNSDTAYNLASSAMSANPRYEYWLIACCIDNYADGAARAAAQLGKQDKTAVASIGGTDLMNRWDTGEESSWKSAVYTAQLIYAEPIFMAVYAQMSGVAPEALWPEWVDKSSGEAYASLCPPSFIITIDDYKEYMEWVDRYTGVDYSPYEYKGTQFGARAVPPASYAG